MMGNSRCGVLSQLAAQRFPGLRRRAGLLHQALQCHAQGALELLLEIRLERRELRRKQWQVSQELPGVRFLTAA